ncbi:MAG: YggS family pyridoxal phosphate-dependent enzyme [Pseudomonadales bacterium]|nr:YggS family pyridoxal phosphate-dependent enzyme [Pseudomonadales bacterium]
MIHEQIQMVHRAIEVACDSSGRDNGSVRVLAVSKTRSSAEIRLAYDSGIENFGENYVQEAVQKIHELRDLPLTWHYIGGIQSNKTKDLARYFQWVHSIDRANIASRLNAARAEFRPNNPLNVCLQLNLDEEVQKSGVSARDVEELLRHTKQLTHLRVRGFMTIPKPNADSSFVQEGFRQAAELFRKYRDIGDDNWDTLSMGMSNDFAIAVAEGATLLRLGTVLFGPRVSLQ